MMKYNCGSCIHCADRHGDRYRINDGVCLLIGCTVSKDNDNRGLRSCGIMWEPKDGEYKPRDFMERDTND